LHQDQEVEVAVEAVAGLTVTGKVERIAPQATIRNNIKGFAVRILLKDVAKSIRPGMTANIKIPVASADDVVAVPLAAVFTERDPQTYQTERFVYARTGEDQYERRPIRIGVSDFFLAEVQSGLTPGEVVSLEPPAESATVTKIARRDNVLPGARNADAAGGGQRGPGARPSTTGTQRTGGAGGPRT
jgi:HlyD family secretion protein